jgi:small subunit ribosomal protein S20
MKSDKILPGSGYISIFLIPISNCVGAIPASAPAALFPLSGLRRSFIVPRLASSKKRLRTSIKAQMRNKAIRSQMRTDIKKVRQAADKASAQQALQQALSTIDRTAQKRVIHKKTAARYKSRLSHRVQTLS